MVIIYTKDLNITAKQFTRFKYSIHLTGGKTYSLITVSVKNRTTPIMFALIPEVVSNFDFIGDSPAKFGKQIISNQAKKDFYDACALLQADKVFNEFYKTIE